MTDTAIVEIPAVGKYSAPKRLFRHRVSGEYFILVPRPGFKHSHWVSLGTSDRVEAMQRMDRTGIASLIEAAKDDRLKEQVAKVLTSGPRVTMEQVYKEFLADLALRLHRKSLCHYEVIIRQFIQLFRPNTDIKEPSPARMTSWVNTAPTMDRRRRRQSVLCGFFTFAFDQGYREDNPGKRIGLNLQDLTFEQMERSKKEPFLKREVDQIVACPQSDGFWRWSVQLAWWLGLRQSDCCFLQWGSFCAEPGKLVFWQIKTRRRNSLDLSDPVLGGGIINKIVEEMKKDATDEKWCFPKWREFYLEYQPMLSQLFRELCIQSGLSGYKTFSCLRTAAAQRWQMEGRSIKEIGQLLGHEGTGNTDYYLK